MEPHLYIEDAVPVMPSFELLLAEFENQFNDRLFPSSPANLYNAIAYVLDNRGKRIRPVLCLMGNVLTGPLQLDAFQAANAIELFHNFALVHDDIMDRVPLRRGKPAAHIRYNTSTAILTGDTILLYAYEYLNRIQGRYKHKVIQTFNEAARAVCEGQQMDLDMENLLLQNITYQDYLQMITLKVAVLIAASLQIGGIIGGAFTDDQEHLYAFGKYLGTAFQVQDDYLDAFGDFRKTGKQPGDDIITNKKTFLLVKAYELSNAAQKSQLQELLTLPIADKIPAVLQLYRDCKVGEWALKEKDRLQHLALQHLESMSVPAVNKRPLLELAALLLNRQF